MSFGDVQASGDGIRSCLSTVLTASAINFYFPRSKSNKVLKSRESSTFNSSTWNYESHHASHATPSLQRSKSPGAGFCCLKEDSSAAAAGCSAVRKRSVCDTCLLLALAFRYLLCTR